MAEAVVCPACGAKTKRSRPRCPRCEAPLTQGDTSAEPRWWQMPAGTQRGPLLIAGIVLSLVVLFIIAFLMRPSTRPTGEAQVPSAPPRSSAPNSAAGQPSAAPARSASNASADEPPFLDSDRAGTAAYGRGDLAAALQRFQEAVDKNPRDLESLNNLGQVLTRLERAPEAIPYFERAIQLDPARWASRFNLAHAYGQQGDWTRAVAEYRTALALFPDDYATHYNLAMVLHRLGQEEAAIPELEKAIELAPGEASFRLSIGLTYERLNRGREAARAYQEYLELAPAAPDAKQVKARIDVLTQPASPENAAPPAQAAPKPSGAA